MTSIHIPRKPTVEVVSNDAHHHRFGAAPISGCGLPEDGMAMVVIFRQVIRNGKLAWKKMGEARFDLRYGLHARPHALPSDASVDLAEALAALPKSVW